MANSKLVSTKYLLRLRGQEEWESWHFRAKASKCLILVFLQTPKQISNLLCFVSQRECECSYHYMNVRITTQNEPTHRCAELHQDRDAWIQSSINFHLQLHPQIHQLPH